MSSSIEQHSASFEMQSGKNVIMPKRPFRIDFEVSGTCNLNCKYCLARPFSGFNPPLSSLISLFEKTKREVNPFEVVLAGGEPMSRKDFSEMIVEAKNVFGALGLSTNGTYISKLSRKNLEVMAEVFPRGELQISLDSVYPAINDITRGNTTEVLRGLDRLEEIKIPFTIGIVVTHSNIKSIESSFEYLIQRYPSFRRISLMNLMPSEILGRNFFAMKTDRIGYLRAVENIQKILRENGRTDISVISDAENSHVQTALDRAGFKTCFAGFTRIDVLPNGDVTPCSMIRSITIGNVYSEPWETIINRSMARFNELNKGEPKGAQCFYFNL